MPHFVVDLDIFKKYMARVKSDTTAFSDHIPKALEKCICYERPKDLADALLAVRVNIKADVFAECVAVTKSFINSQDCHYLGKYETRYSFFGIRYVAAAALLKSLNESLDEVMAKPVKIVDEATAVASVQPITTSGISILKSGLRMLTSSPHHLLLLLFSLQITIVSSAQKNMRKREKVESSELFLPLSRALLNK